MRERRREAAVERESRFRPAYTARKPPTAARVAAPLALMAVIFYLSAQPSVGPELPAFTRVIAHFTEYALLAALWTWALAPALGTRALLVAGAVSFAYAVGDEYHQSFVEGRDSDPLDVLVDTAGIAAALWLGGCLGTRVRGRRAPRRARQGRSR